MRSFASLASLALAAVVSALPITLPAGGAALPDLSVLNGGVVNTVVGTAANAVPAVTTVAGGVANAVPVVPGLLATVGSIQGGQVPRDVGDSVISKVVGTTGVTAPGLVDLSSLDPGLLNAITTVTGLSVTDILTQVANIQNPDISSIDISAVPDLTPESTFVLAVVKQIVPGVDINNILSVYQTTVPTLPTDQVQKRQDAVDGVVDGASNSTDSVNSLPCILNGLVGKLQPLNDELNTIISSNSELSAIVIAVTPVLTEIKGHLTEAVTLVQSLASNPVDGVLTLEGQVLSLPAIAQIYATLFNVVGSVVTLVFKTVGSLQVGGVLSLVTDIVTALVSLVTFGVQIAGGLLGELVPVVQSLLSVVAGLNLPIVSQILATVFNLQA
ncbi:hypothetical protein P691DRAFT_776366 [Macrolepiota fuliginosa MF-IS2]|uniref:Uncharacterized protein n=1 Tax=Macrolepiota fuliginosa MF-IS2 TaxID=1400762 RepID=A0A9P5X9U1_9AGAR|nr:hypothetical protein P691DRAFT_776366 [Macrolepiota fuliginosa MF-IS2]